MALATPGPWGVGKPYRWHRQMFVPITSADRATVGMAFADALPEPDAITLANAHLMAAAHDLLAALKGVLRVADRATDEFDAARAAIAKAEGAQP